MSKYHSRKVVKDGITFDSIKEYRRFCELSLMEKSGTISHLQRQVKFVLIPTQRAESTSVYTKGSLKGSQKPGIVLERECSYTADFVYYRNGKCVVEDAKGLKTEVYKIKKKLMLYVHGIRIEEV